MARVDTRPPGRLLGLAGHFTTCRASKGGTEAINGTIELHRRTARGFRNPANHRLRMILAAGRLTHPKLR